MIENKVVVGISQGDINGIGLEIILKTLLEPELSEICIPVLFSSQKTVSYFRKALNLDEFNFNPLRDFNQIHTKKPNVFICYEEVTPVFPSSRHVSRINLRTRPTSLVEFSSVSEISDAKVSKITKTGLIDNIVDFNAFMSFSLSIEI